MTDIVVLLRKYAPFSRLHGEAADEIELLRAEAGRLRGAGDAMARAMRRGSDSGWDDAIDAWEDASGLHA